MVVHAGVAYVSGQLPRRGDELVRGRVGEDVALEAAQAAAGLCAVAVLAVLRQALGELAQVERCLQLSGFVNAAPDFTRHSEVMNGASALVADAFGEAGTHTRAAVGVASLPFGVPVEVSAVFAIRGPAV